MPNWCANRVTVQGTGVELFKGYVSSDESAFSLHTIKPMPAELLTITTGFSTIDGEKVRAWRSIEDPLDSTKTMSLKISDEEMASLVERFGTASWYDWAVANWGTKWDVSGVEVEEDFFQSELEGLVYRFETAWSPPGPICEHLRNQFPELNIEWFWDEPGMQEAGYL